MTFVCVKNEQKEASLVRSFIANTCSRFSKEQMRFPIAESEKRFFATCFRVFSKDATRIVSSAKSSEGFCGIRPTIGNAVTVENLSRGPSSPLTILIHSAEED